MSTIPHAAGLAHIERDHLNTPSAIIDPTRNAAIWRWDLTGDAFGAHAANDDADGDGIRYQVMPARFTL